MSFGFASFSMLAAAAVIAGLCLLLLLRARLGRGPAGCFALASALVALAAAGLYATRQHEGEIVVMVDLSPSTRSADYRDPATLNAQLAQLLPGRRPRLIAFAREQTNLPSASRFFDLPADKTVFASPPA